MQGISATLVNGFLDVFNFKKMVEKSLIKPSRRNKPFNLTRYEKLFFVSQFQVMGKSVVTLQPKVDCTQHHIVFLHGGAYLLEGSAMHWKLLETIALKANCKVSYIDYPLAPEYNYKTTFEMVQQSYDKLVNENPNDIFMLMGDSAGGGLALAFAQKLRNENAIIQPLKLVLFSPWIDMQVENSELEKLDKILSVDALREAAKKYAGGHDLSHYLLSPINGNFEGLGEILIFYGTHEILYSDCLRLKVKTAGITNFHFEEFEKMQHDWVLFPIPEAKQALKIAVNFIIS